MTWDEELLLRKARLVDKNQRRNETMNLVDSIGTLGILMLELIEEKAESVRLSAPPDYQQLELPLC